MMNRQIMTIPYLFFCAISAAYAYIPPFFSLSDYQRARAEETSQSLDASRFHFQVLIVDNDNLHGRIVEGILERIAEYNDALFTLFPASATIESSPKAPIDSAAPVEAVAVCELLGLCSIKGAALGTSFDLSCLDDYDLIISLDDDVQSVILRSLPADSSYAYKCRLLSEFLSPNFVNIQRSETNNNIGDDTLLMEMVDPELLERTQSFYKIEKDSNVFSAKILEDVYEPATMMLACAGITRFCLDTMDAQFDTAFTELLERHFYRIDHLGCSIRQADDQLRRGSFSITGYFSPQQRHARIEQHLSTLRSKLL